MRLFENSEPMTFAQHSRPIAGNEGIGSNHEALVRAFATNLVDNILIASAGHFVTAERPLEITAVLRKFLTANA
jgi:hypothetical protein